MKRYMNIGGRGVGDEYSCFLVAEIGLNHNGDVDIARMLMDEAADAGFDAVKFQKREPKVCTPRTQWDKMRETPWGYIPYIEYRDKVEFWEKEYNIIDNHAKSLGILWSASVWDEPSVDFLMQYDPPFIKLPSAAITDLSLLKKVRETGVPIVMSTGMSTMTEIYEALDTLSRVVRDPLNQTPIAVLHCTSTYPAAEEEINLRMITTLLNDRALNGMPIGYSGHEVSLTQSVAAVALGASIVERHVTLDRTMWGSDHAASVEPRGMQLLVKRIRRLERSLGDGVKQVYESERPIIEKLRKAK